MYTVQEPGCSPRSGLLDVTFKRRRRIARDVRTERVSRRLPEASAVVAALYLTAGMLWLLASPDSRLSRLALAVTAIVLAWVGVYGVAVRRTRLVEVAALGLATLGIWQAVAWLFMLPTGAVLAVIAAVLARANDGGDRPGRAGDGDRDGEDGRAVDDDRDEVDDERAAVDDDRDATGDERAAMDDQQTS